MENKAINVPGMEALTQPRTRKDFFKAVAVAGAGAAIGSSIFSRKAFAQSSGGDLDIANFALTLEYLEGEFYTLAVDSGVLSGSALGVVTNLRDHELAHVDALIGLIEQFGGTPVAKPEFTFPPESLASQQGVLDLAITLEPVGVGAYLGAAPLIQDPDVLAAAGSIAGVEGEHVVAVNNLLGVVPPANQAFPEALTQDQVLAAVAPFLGMAEMPDTGGRAKRGTARAL